MKYIAHLQRVPPIFVLLIFNSTFFFSSLFLFLFFDLCWDHSCSLALPKTVSLIGTGTGRRERPGTGRHERLGTGRRERPGTGRRERPGTGSCGRLSTGRCGRVDVEGWGLVSVEADDRGAWSRARSLSRNWTSSSVSSDRVVGSCC